MNVQADAHSKVNGNAETFGEPVVLAAVRIERTGRIDWRIRQIPAGTRAV